MNPTEPVKRLKFGFIFLYLKYRFKSRVHSKRDLNPQYYSLYDLQLGVDLMLNFFIFRQFNFHISIAFRLWFVSLWQREYQLHRENKYLKIEYLLKSQAQIRVWLFFISRHYFSLKGLWSLTYSTVTKFSFLMFRLMPSCPCRKAENKKGVTKK